MSNSFLCQENKVAKYHIGRCSNAIRPVKIGMEHESLHGDKCFFVELKLFCSSKI